MVFLACKRMTQTFLSNKENIIIQSCHNNVIQITGHIWMMCLKRCCRVFKVQSCLCQNHHHHLQRTQATKPKQTKSSNAKMGMALKSHELYVKCTTTKTWANVSIATDWSAVCSVDVDKTMLMCTLRMSTAFVF